MGGEYFDLPGGEHRCTLPDSFYGAPKRGWRCDCGKAWVTKTVSQHGESWMEWHRAPGYDRTD